MSGLGQTFRNWLQHSFKIALPIRYNTKDSIEEAEKNSPYKEEHSKAGDRGHWFRQIYKYDPLYICFGITFLANPNVSLRMEVSLCNASLHMILRQTQLFTLQP